MLNAVKYYKEECEGDAENVVDQSNYTGVLRPVSEAQSKFLSTKRAITSLWR